MAAALTPSYVSQSQPCPSHPTAGARRDGAGGLRGRAQPALAHLRLGLWGAGGKSWPSGVSRRSGDMPQPPPGRHLGRLCVCPPLPPSPARGHQLAQPRSASSSGGTGKGGLSPCSASSFSGAMGPGTGEWRARRDGEVRVLQEKGVSPASKGMPRPKAPNAALSSDLKHRAAAGRP